jgi:hypothetical protein
MTEKKFNRVVRPATAEERKRHAEIREMVMKEFPPSPGAGRRDAERTGMPPQLKGA